MEFADQWLWLVFVGVGLGLVVAEFVTGAVSGFDMAIFGSVFILGGLVASPFDSWPTAVIVTSVLSVAYVVIGRRYVRRWTQARKARTNIDAIIGRRALVVKDITKYAPGRIEVGGVRWRASADDEIGKGQEVTVTEVRGATLIVQRTQGGD